MEVSNQRQCPRSLQLECQFVVRGFGHIVKAHVAQEGQKQQFQDHFEASRGLDRITGRTRED